MASNSTLGDSEPIGRISRRALIPVIWVLVFIAFFFLLARIANNLYVFRRLHVADGFAILSFALLTINGALTTVIAPAMYDFLAINLGRKEPPPGFSTKPLNYLEYQLASMLLFWSCLWSVKASFLAFLRPLTGQLSWPRRAWWIVTIITVLAFIATVITYPISCTSFVLGDCRSPGNTTRALISLRFSTSVDIITDFLIIVLPVSIVVRIKISTKEKIGLIVVLGLGVFIIGFAITRVVLLDNRNAFPEITWLVLWSAIESSVAVVVCCLPSFKVLLTARRQGSFRQRYFTPESEARVGKSKGAPAVGQGHTGALGPSQTESVALTTVKVVECGAVQEPWMDDSSSQLEILGDKVYPST